MIDEFDIDDAPAASEADVNEARSLGWAPRDRWRGRPEDFIEAPEFLRRAREHLPVVKGLLDKERAERARDKAAFEAKQAEFEKRIAAQARMSQKALDMQKQQLVEQFEGEKRYALSLNDPAQRHQAYERAQHRERVAFDKFRDEEQTEPAPKPQQAPQAQPVPQEMQAWGAKNPWFFADAGAREDAIRKLGELDASEPYMDLSEKLDRVTQAVKKQHPRWFPREEENEPTNEPAARQHQMVEGGNPVSRNAKNSRVKGFKELPPETKAACEDCIKRGFARPRHGEDPEKAKARYRNEYAATYWSESDD
jgi:hypothetical protein